MALPSPQSRPGVYVNERKTLPPIVGVGTSTAAFLGHVPENVAMPDDPEGEGTYQVAEPNTPTLVTNWQDFTRKFGRPGDDSKKALADAYEIYEHLAGAVYGFFQNGGARCFVVRLLESDKKPEKPQLIPLGERPEKPGELPKEPDEVGEPEPPADPEKPTPAEREAWEKYYDYRADKREWDRAHELWKLRSERYTEWHHRHLAYPDEERAYKEALAEWETKQETWLKGLKSNVGDALGALEAVDEVALVVFPGAVEFETQNLVVDHCTRMEDRFAILDATQTLDVAQPNESNQLAVGSFAAAYFPWIEPNFPWPTDSRSFPPSGHVSGMYARTDSEQGVHKAPANERLYGALGVSRSLTKEEQGGLNFHRVNVIRDRRGEVLVWGARTRRLVGSHEFVSTRRLLNYIRESLQEGMEGAVFKPNPGDRKDGVQKTITRNGSRFLEGLWRRGALAGSSPEEAFYFVCDESVNPPVEMKLGRVNAEVGLSITMPAEFIVIQLSQEMN